VRERAVKVVENGGASMANPASRWVGAVLAVAWALTCGLAAPAAVAGPLRLVTDQWIPYENLSDADAPGFSTEVLKAVFASMKQDVSFEEFPWARAARLVFRGERDALFTAFYDEERAGFCHFPKEPLARDKWIFFVRTADAGRLKFSSFADLVGHEIAVLRGASISPEFWAFAREQRTIRETASDEVNMRLLEAGRVDYVVASFANGMRLIRSLGLDGKIEPLLSRSLKEDDLYVIFSKERVSASFVDAFSEALRRFKQTEAFRVIYRKYFPAPRGSTNPS
jgi:polar amino acid transport system substrate-binding protein